MDCGSAWRRNDKRRLIRQVYREGHLYRQPLQGSTEQGIEDCTLPGMFEIIGALDLALNTEAAQGVVPVFLWPVCRPPTELTL